MPRFLNTSATNYFLAELIKSAKDRLILIRPFLKLNDRIKEILMDKGSREAYEEAQRIIRISDEVRILLERINAEDDEGEVGDGDGKQGKLTTSKLCKKLGMKTDALLNALAKADYLSFSDGKHTLTDKGAGIGREFVPKSRFGAYFLWPGDLQLQ